MRRTPYGTRESSVHGKCLRLLGIDNSDASDTSGGVLAWYSLIHHEPSTSQRALGEFVRVLRPGGGLLMGFFVAPEVEAFDHAIVEAYPWSVEPQGDELRDAGFEVIEMHTRTGFHSKPRPHGAILAQLANAR